MFCKVFKAYNNSVAETVSISLCDLFGILLLKNINFNNGKNIKSI